jgi:hypothetical protein
MQATALALMTYFIKTMHGISDASYQLFGTGQGSGGSPSIWLYIVVVLLQMLSVMAHMAMSFADPWGDIMHERNADSYVDDTSIGITDATMDEPLPLPDMFANMQDVAQKWERILYSSGGALELPKCFWYLIYWEWVNGRPQMMPNLSTPGVIALTQGQVPNYTVIKHLEVWQAMRTLGIRAAPDGNYRKEAGFLQNKANTYASRLITSNLTEMDTFIFHQSTYTPSMTYSIALTALTVTQLNKIQRRAIQAILNKLGINQNFPHRVTFGPKDLCGMALLDLSVKQGVRQIQHFMNHIFAEDSVGNLILIALRFLQIESGSGKHILFHPDEYIPYLTTCWLTSLRDFLARHDIQLDVTKVKLIEKSREGDCYLMDDFGAIGIFDDDELYDINLCQIVLQVTTLSDIADAAGKAISAEIFDGKKSSDWFSLHRWLTILE